MQLGSVVQMCITGRREELEILSSQHPWSLDMNQVEWYLLLVKGWHILKLVSVMSSPRDKMVEKFYSNYSAANSVYVIKYQPHLVMFFKRVSY